MKSLLILLLLGVTVLSRADEIEPAVNTSSAPQTPTETMPVPTGTPPTPTEAQGTPSQATPAPPRAPPRGSPAPAKAPAAKVAGTAKEPAGRKSSARDEIELDPTQITGNRELPKVMYVVPWKRPDIGDMGGGPAKSLIDEALAPVDRDVFRRQNRYFTALQAQSAAAPAKPTVAPAAGATITLPSGDEK
jgi:hypothetical protein